MVGVRNELDPEVRAKGVIAFSSGNHAQGVAAAAKGHGVPAVIIMPEDAPALKIANTRALGADVVTYDRHRESREAIATQLANDRGATIVPGARVAGEGPPGGREGGRHWRWLWGPC